MSPNNSARQAQCAHARRWFYRSPFRFAGGRPSVDLVERCQECGHLVRSGLTKTEVEASGMLVAALDLDPWEPKGTR